MLLSDVDVRAISMVKKGANGQRIFLFKSAEGAGDDLAVFNRIIKAGHDGEWSTFYIVVAEPGTEEEPGIATDDQSIRDVWASEDEIRKAAHGFMRNGALINKMHEDFAPYGKLVENAVAPCDMLVEGPEGEQTIKKGSWYIGIEPSAEGKAMVEAGEFTGVSIQGSGQRTPDSFDGPELALIKPKISKGTAAYMTDYDRDLIGELLAEPIEKGSSAALPDLDWSAAENWIDRLPAAMGAAFKRSWIYRAAKHLTYEVYGGNRGHAFAVAIEAARKGCATGDLNWPGLQQVNPGSRAEMCAAVSLWESMKATAGAQKLTKQAEEAIAKMDAAAAGLDTETAGRFRRALEFFGVVEPSSEDQSGELAKEAGTVEPVSESTEKTTGAEEKTLEQRVEALEGLGTRVDGIEKSVKDLTDLDLGGKLESIAKRLPEPEETAPTAEELAGKVDELATSTAATLEKMAADISQLAEGESTQTGDELKKAGNEDSYESALL